MTTYGTKNKSFYERFIEEVEAMVIMADEGSVRTTARLTRAAKRAQMVFNGDLEPVASRDPTDV